jgi:hypothetical protein
MKNFTILSFFLVLTAVNVFGQTSNSEKNGYWDQGTSWSGGVFPGTVSSGVITAVSKVIVVDGTIKSNKSVSLNLSSLTIHASDTLVILGNLNLTASSLTNNGILIVIGNVVNDASTSATSGTGKLVVTGNYTNVLGLGNTFTGPSYVYGSTNGFLFAPSVDSKANLISNDLALYNYVNLMNGALPIELISFNASIEGSSVLLFWSTATEINNDHFTIERSGNGKTFETIATIDGAGNSKKRRNYSSVDNQPLPGKSYYRLSQTDYDGHGVQFHIVYVSREEQGIRIYPNPTVEYLYFNEPKDGYSVSVKDMRGLSLSKEFELQETQSGESSINVSDLKPGVYYLILTSSEADSHSRTFRFVKN